MMSQVLVLIASLIAPVWTDVPAEPTSDLVSLNRCGPLSLHVCAAAVDKAMSATELERLFPANGQEANANELERGARELGLHVLPLRWDGAPPSFSQAPAIIPIVNREQRRHFVVMLESRTDYALIVDSPWHPAWIPLKQLRDDLKWDGSALYIAENRKSLEPLRSHSQPWRHGFPITCGIFAILLSFRCLAPRRNGYQQKNAGKAHGNARAGITIVEVLVAIAMIGLLVALLLPAVQSSRESSRKIQCIDHLRQIGTACAAHESSFQRFPAALMGDRAPSAFIGQRLAPQVALLPFVDQRNVWEMIDLQEDGLGAGDDPPTSIRNASVLSINIPLYLCPSDAVPIGGNSYRVSIGTSPQMHETIPQDEKAAKVGALAGQGRGVYAARIRDGLSQTVFFSEKLVGDRDVDAYYPSRDYFLAGGDFRYPDDALDGCRLAVGINPDHVSFGGSTWLLGGYDFTWYNHIATPNAQLPDCSSGRQASGAVGGSFAARSPHPGGVNVVFGDGAARLISNSIDLQVWRALGTRSGTENVTASY